MRFWHLLGTRTNSKQTCRGRRHTSCSHKVTGSCCPPRFWNTASIQSIFFIKRDDLVLFRWALIVPPTLRRPFEVGAYVGILLCVRADHRRNSVAFFPFQTTHDLKCQSAKIKSRWLRCRFSFAQNLRTTSCATLERWDVVTKIGDLILQLTFVNLLNLLHDILG